MSVKPARVQFNGGELSPWLEGRFDIAKYDKTARLCRNFIPMAEGSLKRRGGTRFVAQTLVEDDVVFTIKATPANAKIIINGEEQSSISVARGDVVLYDVSADGYASQSGRVTVTDDKTLEVNLISLSESFILTIVPTPADAIVKINGYEQSSAEIFKNDEATYVVYKDGYILKSGSVVVNKDTTLEIVLDKDEEETVSYGSWGNVVGLVACSAVGSFEANQKCFYIRFTNGYLPVLFSALDEAPTDINESLFFVSLYDNYDSVAIDKNDNYVHTTISKTSGGSYLWKDHDGTAIFALDSFLGAVMGWQIDDYGHYATIYDTYIGVVSSNILKVYHNNKLVWTLKGRSNG